MDRYEQYRRNAEEAERQAKNAKNDSDRAAWLRLEQDWLSLLPKRNPNEAEGFAEKVETQGTHQTDSEASH